MAGAHKAEGWGALIDELDIDEEEFHEAYESMMKLFEEYLRLVTQSLPVPGR